jgi:hypothetical protein
LQHVGQHVATTKNYKRFLAAEVPGLSRCHKIPHDATRLFGKAEEKLFTFERAHMSASSVDNIDELLMNIL